MPASQQLRRIERSINATLRNCATIPGNNTGVGIGAAVPARQLAV
jgi:hypothetical protein